jgi:hypothetical protein
MYAVEVEALTSFGEFIMAFMITPMAIDNP